MLQQLLCGAGKVAGNALQQWSVITFHGFLSLSTAGSDGVVGPWLACMVNEAVVNGHDSAVGQLRFSLSVICCSSVYCTPVPATSDSI